MFDRYAIRGSLWKQRVNTILGTLFLSTFALWAALVMIEFKWGVDPLSQAFTAAPARETELP